jgi:hypothetical protein
MNEEELERLDEMLGNWSRAWFDGGGKRDRAIFELQEKLIEFINEITVDIISLAHPSIKEHGQQEDK